VWSAGVGGWWSRTAISTPSLVMTVRSMQRSPPPRPVALVGWSPIAMSLGAQWVVIAGAPRFRLGDGPVVRARGGGRAR
jgi:hypothetical protein